jgi:CheY-like chemotaxis protein
VARILIVDDDPDFLALASAVLAAGHETETALGSLAALERVLARPYDVIVSDVHMPGMSGFLLAEQVQRANTVQVVFASSRDHRGECLLRGGAGFVAKPVTPQALRAAVERVLAPPARRYPVLLVETEDVLRELFATSLEDLEVITANSAAQALEKLAANPEVALVLTDHAPPRVDARELLACVRGLPAWAHLPVVVHTVSAEGARAAHFAAYGVERVMEKTAFLRFLLNAGELRRRAHS